MKNKKIIKVILAVLLLLFFTVPLTTTKATEDDEIELAIEAGLEWLAGQQRPDGDWGYSSSPSFYLDIATTALVLLKFEERAKELGLNPFETDESAEDYYEYASNIIAGFEYIFSYAQYDSINSHIWLQGYETYSTGTVMMAVAASNNPGWTITIGTDTLTFEEALQYMMNWMEETQEEGAKEEGGWDYSFDPGDGQNWADQSNTGYATLGIGFAAAPAPHGFGLTIPESVLTKLDTYINNVQDPVDGDNYDGGSWYEPNYQYKWVNILKTGNLLYEMALVGDEITDTRVENAINYIADHWNDVGQQPEFQQTSLGWKDSYQAMFTMMKGFEAFGIETITVGGMDIDWFEEVSAVILANQHEDGFFNYINTGITEGEESQVLRTAWALLTLERIVPTITIPVNVDIKPGSWPNPINLKSKGVLPVAICGTLDFDVTTIDPISVHIGGVSALRWSYEDVATPFEDGEGEGHALNGDGYPDLVLHFEIQEIIEALGLTDFAGQKIPLEIEGNLKEEEGGIPIRGSDYVWILGGEKWFILDPILIDDQGGGDYTWKEAKEQPWCKGVGTLKKPYIIENVIIEGTGSPYCISIYNSEEHFIIRNCILFGIDVALASAALVLYNTTNGVIIDNFCFDNGDPIYGELTSGICILDSNNIIIKENNCTGNTAVGIYLAASNNTDILDNNCEENNRGLVITGPSPHTIGVISEKNSVSNNDCSNNVLQGILILEGAKNNEIINNNCSKNTYGIELINSDWNIILDNDCSENSQYGIILYDDADNNEINENTCNNNYWGILLAENSDDNKMTGNDCIYNSENGIVISNSDNNIIDINNCSENGGTGIKLVANAEQNLVIGSYCTGNYYGMYMNEVYYNEISGNDCLGNSYGVYMYNSHYNEISGNNCSGNSYGVYMYSSQYNEISGNDCLGNSYGMYIYICRYNEISENNCSGNVYGTFMYYCFYNEISGNDYSGNYYGMYMYYCFYDEFFENEIIGCFIYGVVMYYCWYQEAYHNNFNDNNYYSLYLYESYYNWIHHNNFTDNIYYGLILYESYYNSIHHNNFIDNAISLSSQVFEQPAGYNYWYIVDEGNYWSDRVYSYDYYPLDEMVEW